MHRLGFGRQQPSFPFRQKRSHHQRSGQRRRCLQKSSFGLRSGSVTVNSLDEAAIEKAQARSEEIARLSPENPEFMPPLAPQTYEPGGARFDPATAACPRTPSRRRRSRRSAPRRDVRPPSAALSRPAVLLRARQQRRAFRLDRGTSAELTVTARTPSRPWSGWAGASQNRFRALDAEKLGERAVRKAIFPGEPWIWSRAPIPSSLSLPPSPIFFCNSSAPWTPALRRRPELPLQERRRHEGG